jgi:hypothetical protein
MAALAAAALLVVAPAAARAAVLYSFVYTETPGIGFPGGGVGNISGTFTVDDAVSPNRIIGIAGMTALGPITGLVVPSGAPGTPDNVFLPGSTFLTANGVAFTDGFGQITLGFEPVGGFYFAVRSSPTASSVGTLSVTAVPAPAALGLFGLGLLGLAAAGRRRG